jgi:hypothetical protein
VAVRAQRPCLENPNMVTHGLRLATHDSGRSWTVSTRARGVNVNLELSRSRNGVRNGFRRPDGRGSGQFAESALDTLYVARNRG